MRQQDLIQTEIGKCVRCGTCRSVCPVFKALGRETACARGKLTLIGANLNGDLPLTEAYVKHVKECTLCGACKANCPNGVDTTRVYAAAREDIAAKQGLPFTASFILKHVLDSGRVMPLAMKWANRIQSIIFKDSSAGQGLLSRFTTGLVGSGRLVPQLAQRFFLDLPDVKALSGGSKSSQGAAKVAFYAGCGVNYLMPEVGVASIGLLKRAGVDVVVPSAQVCCGIPAYSMGDMDAARAMALKNLEAFESTDAAFIATSCATCGYALKKLFKELLGDDPKLAARVEAFSKKVRDITELLVDDLGFKGGGNKAINARVTYHDPCHLGRGQGVREAPRVLIASAKGAQLKEMKNPCACCGLGGGLSLANYELSMEIARKKAENIRNSGAGIVATACPGCMVHLRDGLHRFGVDVKVAHVVELL